MPCYRLMIEAYNLPGVLFQEPDMLYGFVTSRWVQAANPDDAEVAGIESVRAEFVDLLRNRVQRDPAPMMYLVDIDEIARIPDDAVNSGASWFPMEED